MESRNIYGSTSGFIYYNPITGRTYRIAGGNPNPTNNVPSTSRNTQNQREPEKRSSGFGYFLAAIVGFAAALITRSLLYDEPEKSSIGPEYSQNVQKEVDPIDTKLEECSDVVCPITLELMSEPVISKKCGHSFEESAILSWLRSKNFCPKCHENLQRSDLVKNYSLKNAIEYMRKQEKQKGNE